MRHRMANQLAKHRQAKKPFPAIANFFLPDAAPYRHFLKGTTHTGFRNYASVKYYRKKLPVTSTRDPPLFWILVASSPNALLGLGDRLEH